MQYFENFISYRRSETMAEVQNIYNSLQNKGHSVFCDIYSLSSGRFDEKLKSIIKSCTNYILVLSQKSLDRCENEDDWLRCEIREALKEKKNIICIFVGTFIFPDKLPDDIDSIRLFNGIQYDFTYYAAFIDSLISRFLTSQDESIISSDERDFVISANKLIKYLGTAQIVNVPESVSYIGFEAFKDKTRVSEINLPEGIIEISEGAFERCSSLSHIILPESMRTIGRRAFSRCYNLSFVALNDCLESIGDEAFSYCDKLKTLRIGTGLKTISPTAFNSCNKLALFLVEENNEFYQSVDGIIYNKACTRLIRCPEGYDSDLVTIPNTVEELAPWCFSRCLKIVDVVLPIGLKRVKEYAFNDCCNILSLTLSDSVEDFDVSAITGWNTTQRIVVSKRFNPLIKYNLNKQLMESAVIQQSAVDNLAEFIMIKTTFESHEEAANIAKMLVDKKLAASVQLHKIDSFYYWNEEPCNENEIELSCITKGVLYKKVEQFITQHHSYECCQIICVPIEKSSNEFSKWIIDQTE